MDLDGLRAFTEVAARLSFFEAAEVLALSPSALTRRVKRLEADVETVRAREDKDQRLLDSGNIDPTSLTLEDGTLSWSGASATRQSLRTGDRIGGGQLVLDGGSATATLRFADGTTLTLTGDTELTVSDDGQKRLRLGRGLLSANVQPQPAQRPLLIRTSTAELKVLGTVFTVSVSLEFLKTRGRSSAS